MEKMLKKFGALKTIGNLEKLAIWKNWKSLEKFGNSGKRFKFSKKDRKFGKNLEKN